MAFHIRENFRAGSPVSQIPVEWYNSVAAFLSNLTGTFGVRVTAPGRPSSGSPVTVSLDLEWIKEYGMFVTRDDYQNIVGQKAFSANPVMRDTGRAIEWRGKGTNGAVGSTVHAQIAATFGSSGNRTLELSTSNSVRAASLILAANPGAAGFSELAAGVDFFKLGLAGETDGGVNMSADSANISLFGAANSGTGGSLEFHANGAESATSAISETLGGGEDAFDIDTARAFLYISNSNANGKIEFNARSIELIAPSQITITGGTQASGNTPASGGVVIDAPEGLAQLSVSPPLANAPALAIATCGWAGLRFATAAHSHGPITSDGKLTESGSSVSKVVVTDSLGNLFVTNPSTIAPPIDLSNYVTATALETTLADYVTTSSLETTLADYVTSDTLSNYVTQSDLGAYVTQATYDWEIMEIWEAINDSGGSSSAYSGTKTVAMNPTWTGSALKYTPVTFTFSNGLCTEAQEGTEVTIDTPVKVTWR